MGIMEEQPGFPMEGSFWKDCPPDWLDSREQGGEAEHPLGSHLCPEISPRAQGNQLA